LEDQRNVGESSCNFGDGTDKTVQSLMFMMMISHCKVIYEHLHLMRLVTGLCQDDKRAVMSVLIYLLYYIISHPKIHNTVMVCRNYVLMLAISKHVQLNTSSLLVLQF